MKTISNNPELEKNHGNITSGDNLSVWFAYSNEPIEFEKLSGEVETDILVVGGGIAGCIIRTKLDNLKTLNGLFQGTISVK